jgi:hypothetical protein
MAQFVFLDAFISLAGVEYSPYVKSITFNFIRLQLEDSSMGDTTHSKKPGLNNWTVDVEFFSDFVDDGMDEILQALTGEEVAIKIRPVRGSIYPAALNPVAPTDANPEYQMTGLLQSWPPVSGGIGEMSIVRAHFVAAGDVVRAVA